MAKKHVIDELGGITIVANQLGTKPNVVANWKDRQIPWKWRPTIAAMAKAKGVKLPDDFLTPSAA